MNVVFDLARRDAPIGEHMYSKPQQVGQWNAMFHALGAQPQEYQDFVPCLCSVKEDGYSVVISCHPDGSAVVWSRTRTGSERLALPSETMRRCLAPAAFQARAVLFGEMCGLVRTADGEFHSGGYMCVQSVLGLFKQNGMRNGPDFRLVIHVFDVYSVRDGNEAQRDALCIGLEEKRRLVDLLVLRDSELFKRIRSELYFVRATDEGNVEFWDEACEHMLFADHVDARRYLMARANEEREEGFVVTLPMSALGGPPFRMDGYGTLRRLSSVKVKHIYENLAVFVTRTFFAASSTAQIWLFARSASRGGKMVYVGKATGHPVLEAMLGDQVTHTVKKGTKNLYELDPERMLSKMRGRHGTMFARVSCVNISHDHYCLVSLKNRVQRLPNDTQFEDLVDTEVEAKKRTDFLKTQAVHRQLKSMREPSRRRKRAVAERPMPEVRPIPSDQEPDEGFDTDEEKRRRRGSPSPVTTFQPEPLARSPSPVTTFQPEPLARSPSPEPVIVRQPSPVTTFQPESLAFSPSPEPVIVRQPSPVTTFQPESLAFSPSPEPVVRQPSPVTTFQPEIAPSPPPACKKPASPSPDVRGRFRTWPDYIFVTQECYTGEEEKNALRMRILCAGHRWVEDAHDSRVTIIVARRFFVSHWRSESSARVITADELDAVLA